MRYCVLIAAVCMLSACSLDYGKTVNVEDSIPEFKFTDAVYSQYENNKKTLEISAERIEQYKSDGSSYAKKASFKNYNEDGTLDSEGKCDFLSADTKNDLYTLFENIYVQLHSQDLKIRAQALKFDGKTEQITCGMDDTVSIEKKDTVITGRSFSASGVSKTFSFGETVTGTVVTQDEPVETAEAGGAAK